MERSPKVSFVVPYHKKLHTIKKCVKSLIDQSLKEIEIIVVLDGPDKEAGKILEKLRPRAERKNIRFLVVHSPESGGAPFARNLGLDKAKGEFVAFWDADSVIKPEAAAVWIQAFEKWPELDFVYAGYEFEEGLGGVPSRPFDEYLLEVNNFISGHFPIRRSKCPRWDESLASLQDWDFWLQAVRSGCKGKFIRGYAFQTSFPDAHSISGKGCSPENWLERLEIVKKKHGIPLRDVCVSSISHEAAGVELAKVIGADFREDPNQNPNRYKTLIQVGFNIWEADAHAKIFAAPAKIKKALFWTGSDVQSLYAAPFQAVEGLVGVLNNSVHLQMCEDEVSRINLERFGFKNVSVLPLPLKVKDLVVNPLPKEFKVLCDIAPEYGIFFSSVSRACPDISMDILSDKADIDEYSCFMRFHPDRSMLDLVKRVLLSGRRVVGNIEAKHVNFISDKDPLEQVRKSIIRKLREIQRLKEPDNVASKYYRRLFSPEAFRATLSEILAPKEEVAA